MAISEIGLRLGRLRGVGLGAGIKLIPPFFSNYELEDSIKTEALQATYSTRTEEDIRAAIIKQARNYDIVLTPKQVHVTRAGGVRQWQFSTSKPITAFLSICPATRPRSISSFVEEQRRVLRSALQVFAKTSKQQKGTSQAFLRRIQETE